MIFALRKDRSVPLTAPNSSSCALRAHSKVFIALSKILVNCRLRVILRFIVTVVNDRPRHTVKNRLYNVQELSSGWQWRDIDPRRACYICHGVIGGDPILEPL